ncbi:dicarboxylate/amino acid:cation symporter [Brachybacterium sp. AOP3-A1-3]|uniref:dicarboxylate/amino acid:cation symporter n=1 Tax=Brachybacterium sp. AOP3-A1-3 TaxID=3457699 RepID=UPI0040345031
MSTSTTPSPTTPRRTRNPLRAIVHIPFGWQVLIGLGLGVALGLVAAQMGPVAVTDANPDGANWLTTTLNTIGTIFVTLLKALVPPLIFLAIITSIANLRGVTNAARLAGKTLLWFAITSLIAVSIGIALGAVTSPGANSGISADAAQASDTQGGWMDFLTGLVPTNFLGIEGSAGDDGTVSLSFNALQILVISIAVGIAVLSVGEKAEPFLKVTGSALEIVQKVLWWVIRLAPIGTVGLLGNAVASYGWNAIGQLGVFVADVYIGLFLVLLVVYPVLLKLNGLSIGSFFRGVWPATSLGFVSRSSLGTMPMTQSVTERMGVPRHYASFAVPLGATTKMDGCAAIYPALAAIFVANFYGVPLGVTDYLLIVLVSVLGSAATAGMTGATVMLTLTLSTLGLPLEGVGLLLAIDPILDMGRTALNVTGQSLVAVIVSKREKILDQPAYDDARRTSFQAIQAEEAQDAADADVDTEATAGVESDADREKQPATA